MTEQAYRVTLWKNRPRPLAGMRSLLVDVQRWVDLTSKDAATTEVIRLIELAGGDPEEIEQYRVEVMDLGTGQPLTSLRPSWADLQALREGPAEPRLVSGLTLEAVSDAALLREMGRRLLGRSATRSA